MSKYYTIIDENNRIAKCNPEDIPLELRQDIMESLGEGIDIKDLTFFYDFKEDYIVVNCKHEMYECFKAMLADIVEMELEKVSELYDLAPKSLKNIIKTLFNIMVTRADKKGGAPTPELSGEGL